jgi:16S rRNA (guanine527-N7)-methyltransferase
MPEGPPLNVPTVQFEREILRLAKAHDISLNTNQLYELDRHRELLETWSRRMNLTAIRGMAEVARRHFLEGLLAGKLILKHGASGPMVDLGSGNGFPGVPMGVVCRDARPLVLVDSSQKKAAFLRALGRGLGWENVRVEVRRVDSHEQLMDLPCRVFTSRGVVITELIRAGLPFLEAGGFGLFFRASRSFQEEVGHLPKGLILEEELQLPERREGIIILRKI